MKHVKIYLIYWQQIGEAVFCIIIEFELVSKIECQEGETAAPPGTNILLQHQSQRHINIGEKKQTRIAVIRILWFQIFSKHPEVELNTSSTLILN